MSMILVCLFIASPILVLVLHANHPVLQGRKIAYAILIAMESGWIAVWNEKMDLFWMGSDTHYLLVGIAFYLLVWIGLTSIPYGGLRVFAYIIAVAIHFCLSVVALAGGGGELYTASGPVYEDGNVKAFVRDRGLDGISAGDLVFCQNRFLFPEVLHRVNMDQWSIHPCGVKVTRLGENRYRVDLGDFHYDEIAL